MQYAVLNGQLARDGERACVICAFIQLLSPVVQPADDDSASLFVQKCLGRIELRADFGHAFLSGGKRFSVKIADQKRAASGFSAHERIGEHIFSTEGEKVRALKGKGALVCMKNAQIFPREKIL